MRKVKDAEYEEKETIEEKQKYLRENMIISIRFLFYEKYCFIFYRDCCDYGM